jgi:hypothetical protein
MHKEKKTPNEYHGKTTMIIVTLKLESKSGGSQAWTNRAQVPQSSF